MVADQVLMMGATATVPNPITKHKNIRGISRRDLDAEFLAHLARELLAVFLRGAEHLAGLDRAHRAECLQKRAPAPGQRLKATDLGPRDFRDVWQ